MKIKRISAFALKSGLSKQILDPKEYSNFKYGHKPSVLKFAENLAKSLFSVMSKQWLVRNRASIVVTTSPYWHTPPSAHSLALSVHHILNEYLYENGYGSLPFIKVSRSMPPSCDFSQLDEKERKLNMKNNKLSVDRQAIKGKTVIFVEDSCITGAHEEKFLQCMKKADAAEVIVLYIIDLKNEKIDPNIENILNHSVIDSLDDLLKLMSNFKHYTLNSRVCRFVLSWSDEDELRDFCEKLPSSVLSDLYIASTTDGYGLMSKYNKGFNTVRSEMKRRQKFNLIRSFVRIPNIFKEMTYSFFL